MYSEFPWDETPTAFPDSTCGVIVERILSYKFVHNYNCGSREYCASEFTWVETAALQVQITEFFSSERLRRELWITKTAW